MFIVEWCDQEGNLQQRAFKTLAAAQLEAADLERDHDYVAIIYETEV